MTTSESSSLLHSIFVAMLIAVVIFFIAFMIPKTETMSSEKTTGLLTASQYTTITFVTATAVQKIKGVNAGIVTTKTSSTDSPIKGLVAPYRKIPIGTKVELISINYRNHHQIPVRIMLVKD